MMNSDLDAAGYSAIPAHEIVKLSITGLTNRESQSREQAQFKANLSSKKEMFSTISSTHSNI
jgi:hypothetical protein